MHWNMKGRSKLIDTEADDIVVELQDRVRHDAYSVDPQVVADAVLRDVSANWAAFTEGRARGLGALDRPVRRRTI